MISGIYQALNQGESICLRALSRIQSDDPQTAHDALVIRKNIEREMEVLVAQSEEDIMIIEELDRCIEKLSNPKFESVHRVLALRHLEDAQSRLIRELGDPPLK